MEERISLSIGAAMCLLGYLSAGAAAAFNIYYRKLRFIKMTSPWLNLVMLSGCLISYTGCFLLTTWTNNLPVNQATYQAAVWLCCLGSSIQLNTVMVKGIRILRLFSYPSKDAKVIKDANLMVGVLVMLLFDSVLLLVWQLSDPIMCSAVVNMTICSTQRYQIWLSILLVYKTVQLIAVFAVGRSIHLVTFPALNDSKAMSIVPFVIMLCLICILYIKLLVGEITRQSLRTRQMAALLAWTSTSVLLAISCIDKFTAVYRSGGSEPFPLPSKHLRSGVMSDEHNVISILSDNQQLKHRLQQQDIKIRYLEEASHSSTNCVADSKLRVNETQNVGSHAVSASLSVPSFSHHDRECPIASDVSSGSVEPLPPPTPQHHTADVYAEMTDSDTNHYWVCSIADTYNMSSDSDTLSYISNCMSHTWSQSSSVTRNSGAYRTTQRHSGAYRGADASRSLDNRRSAREGDKEQRVHKKKHRRRRHREGEELKPHSEV